VDQDGRDPAGSRRSGRAQHLPEDRSDRKLVGRSGRVERMKTIHRPQHQFQQMYRKAPGLLIIIHPGAIRVVHVAGNDLEGEVCNDLVRDLQDQLVDLQEAVLRLNR
jgi:hypothetical protein